MSYQGPKPFGRRRTDKSLADTELRQLHMIRRDVDEDDSGTIRRYLRLASRILGKSEAAETNEATRDSRRPLPRFNGEKNPAA